VSRTTITAAVAAAMLAASMPLAFAQTAPTTESPPGTTSASPPGATATETPGAPATDRMGTTATERSATDTLRTAGQAENRLMPEQVRFDNMKGASVTDPQDNNVGTISDIVIDRDGRIVAVVVESGGFLGFGAKKVGLGANEVRMIRDDAGQPRFQVDMTKDQLRAAQAFDLTPKSSATGTTTPPATGTTTAPAGSSPVR
jgi:sporulation protein YlmC with PRC-barrel domain